MTERDRKKERSLFSLSVAIVPLREEGNQILTVLGRRRDGRFTFIGGGLKHGETFFDALEREWKEETGSRIEEMIRLSSHPPVPITSDGPNPSYGFLYGGEFIGEDLPRPPRRSELAEIVSLNTRGLRYLLEHPELLYRPDFNYANLLVLLQILPPNDEYLLFYLTLQARVHTRRVAADVTH